MYLYSRHFTIRVTPAIKPSYSSWISIMTYNPSSPSKLQEDHSAGHTAVWWQEQGAAQTLQLTIVLQQLKWLGKNKFSELLPSREAAKPQTKRLTWWSLNMRPLHKDETSCYFIFPCSWSVLVSKYTPCLLSRQPLILPKAAWKWISCWAN